MADGLHAFLRCLHRLARGPAGGTLSDGQLLERFVAEGDQAAFEVLVWRHGPMVLNVCRRLLGRPEDAEDAFQAAFLVLVRKARSVRRHDALGAWLYRVAYRVARRARAGIARRAGREQPGVDEAPAPAADGGAGPDLRPVLDEEINRLPEKYRAAVVLCCLEGKTHREAAASLGCAEGTVASRLSRARERLRARLVRRGLAVSVAAVTATLAEKAAPAVAAALVEATAKAALQFAAGGPAAGAVSARAAALAKGALRAMWVTKLKTVAAVVLVLGLLGTGLGRMLYSTLNAAPPVGRDEPGATAAGPAAADQDRLNVPSQRDGVLLYVATEIQPGEVVPPERVVEVTETYAYLEIQPNEQVPAEEKVQAQVTVGEDKKETKICRRMTDKDEPDANQVIIASRRRRLKKLLVGDEVHQGQLLAMVDPALAISDFLRKKTKVGASEADYVASVETRDDAEQRLLTARRLEKSPVGRTISPEEVRGAQLTWDRYKYEVIQKKEAIKQARSDLNQALTVLKMHEIRSPAGGVISRLYKRRGEAVKHLESVVQIRLAESESPAAAGAKDKDLLDIPSNRDSILLVLGTEIEQGKKVPPEQVITVKIDGEQRKYRRLRVGDTVEEGQLPARLDDRLARDDLEAKKSKVEAAAADFTAAVKTRDEAEQRYLTIKRLEAANKKVASPEDVRGALLTWDRYKYEVVAKKAAVAAANVEVKSAQTVVEMYEVRSPARGVITHIYKRRGEAVKYLEPVVQIRVPDGREE
jgi:RNA polymerase sigma factor (sigma-70 family)